MSRRIVNVLLVAAACLCFAIAAPVAAKTGSTDTLYYAIEQNGVLCGFSFSTMEHVELDGRPVILLRDSIEMHIKALGADVDASLLASYTVDPETGDFVAHTSRIHQGSVNMGADMLVIDGKVRMIDPDKSDTTFVAITDDTRLQNSKLYFHARQDFADNDTREVRYKDFSVIEGAVHDVVTTFEGEKKATFAGKTYDALRISQLDHTSGIGVDMLVDRKTGLILEASFPGRHVYLTDSSVLDRIEQADIDENIFAKVGVTISDIKGISHMKVRARLQPGGLWLTPEALNVPGQTFDGTVEKNQVDGVFEISHVRYDGQNPPPFPPAFAGRDDLKKYLEPEDMIESDHPDIIAKAKELTDGATDSWTAFKALSKWTAEEITYDIPGGATAIGTFSSRAGECGGHSRVLAALSRAVGIPCRVVWGCMYVPNYGGAFGQHAWNEVYMGDKVGWVPVDATAEEIDYVDCGHIRMGIAESKTIMLNPQEFELIDYKVAGGDAADASSYDAYTGSYAGEDVSVSVEVRNGSLALIIPGRPVFELYDPDSDGQWYFKLTNKAWASFAMDDNGTATELTISSKNRLSRSEDSTAAATDDLPETVKAVIGSYGVPMQPGAVTVAFENDSLVLTLPGPTRVPLSGPNDDGLWEGMVSKGGRLDVSFVREGDAPAIAMDIIDISIFTRPTE